MRNILLRLFFFLMGAGVALVLFPNPGGAFPPPNQRHFDYGQYNAVVPKVASTGVLTWTSTDLYGWAEWRNVVARSLNTGSDYQFSFGNVLAGWISVRPAASIEVADVENFAVPTAFVEAKCGGQFATACIYLLNPRPVPAYYKAASMITFIFTGQAAVIEHEVCHVLCHACDQYQGGCPPTQSQPLRCLGNPETLMDCGLAARYPQPYDLETFNQAYDPPPLDGGTLRVDLHSIFYGPAVKPNSVGIKTATRVAFFVSFLGTSPLEFMGHGPVGEAPGVYGAPVNYLIPCSIYYATTENESGSTWYGERLIEVGRTAC